MTIRLPKLVDQLESSNEPVAKKSSIESYIYWRDPKSSGILFVAGLILLLSLAYNSLISIISNTSLTILAIAMLFRIYNDCCRLLNREERTFVYNFKFLESDILSPEKLHDAVDVIIVHLNAFLVELRRLFLVEDFIVSSKVALMFWVLRYIGAWFSGLTIVIIVFVSAFTLPKVYENNRTLIDENITLIKKKIQEISSRTRSIILNSLYRKTEIKER